LDLSRPAHLKSQMIEIGPSCVHRDDRTGAAILRLWAGLANDMKTWGCRHRIGGASAPIHGGGARAA